MNRHRPREPARVAEELWREGPSEKLCGRMTTTRHPPTEEELLALPDEGRGYERIDGELVEKPCGYRLASPTCRSGTSSTRTTADPAAAIVRAAGCSL